MCTPDGFSTTTSDSDYTNSDRAFIEEWAAAIDMYGAIFTGVALVVTTGAGSRVRGRNGLPELPWTADLECPHLRRVSEASSADRFELAPRRFDNRR